jgi:hypothetical protein
VISDIFAGDDEEHFLGDVGGVIRYRRADSARLTATSPTRSRSELIVIAATMTRRSTTTG